MFLLAARSARTSPEISGMRTSIIARSNAPPSIAWAASSGHRPFYFRGKIHLHQDGNEAADQRIVIHHQNPRHGFLSLLFGQAY
jgi:hypothetical protein